MKMEIVETHSEHVNCTLQICFAIGKAGEDLVSLQVALYEGPIGLFFQKLGDRQERTVAQSKIYDEGERAR